MLAHGRWSSPGTPASSTTKIGRHDIAESGIKAPKINLKIIDNQDILKPNVYILVYDYLLKTTTVMTYVKCARLHIDSLFCRRCAYYKQEQCFHSFFRPEITICQHVKLSNVFPTLNCLDSNPQNH